MKISRRMQTIKNEEWYGIETDILCKKLNIGKDDRDGFIQRVVEVAAIAPDELLEYVACTSCFSPFCWDTRWVEACRAELTERIILKKD